MLAHLKNTIKSLLPAIAVRAIRKTKAFALSFYNRRRSTEEVFTSIYLNNKWGGKSGEFCSGLGSTTESIVVPYVDAIEKMSDRLGFKGTRFVDLGCGDFRIGSQLTPLAGSYIGVDIVKLLIDSNSSRFADEKTSFVQLNIIDDELPAGDVCFVRQVLQHLSNAQIIKVLDKLKQFKFVFITEHYPEDSVAFVPNLDKIHGPDIRLKSNSGVYLSLPPFGIPSSLIEEILSIKVLGSDLNEKHGVIRTFLYRPRNDVQVGGQASLLGILDTI